MAPSEDILTEYETAGKTAEAWEIYKPKFMQKILPDPVALEKIDGFILDSLTQDVVFICFESEKKYKNRCHIFLLLDIAEDRAKENDIPLVIKRENYLF